MSDQEKKQSTVSDQLEKNFNGSNIVELLKNEADMLEKKPGEDVPGYLGRIYNNEQIAVKMRTLINYFESKEQTESTQ